jgi:TonB family protein
MAKILKTLAVVIALCGLAMGELSAREPVREQLPEYPALLKKMGIGGIVRVSAVVNPDGTVKTTKVQGGNPILGELACGAVKKWKYAPANEASNEVVEMTFDSKLASVRVK